MGWCWRRIASVIGSATASHFRGLSCAASTQTRCALSFGPTGVFRTRTGRLGIRNCLGHRHAVDWRSHSSRLSWVCAGLDRDDLWLGCPSGWANSLGETRQTAWIPGRVDSALLPPKGALCALWLARDALLN